MAEQHSHTAEFEVRKVAKVCFCKGKVNRREEEINHTEHDTGARRRISAVVLLLLSSGVVGKSCWRQIVHWRGKRREGKNVVRIQQKECNAK